MSYIVEALTRIKASIEEALTPEFPNLKVSNYPQDQTTFPYVQLRDAGTADVQELGSGFGVEARLVRIYLIAGHVTGGYKGENAERLYEMLPLVYMQMHTKNLIRSDAYPNNPTWWRPQHPTLRDRGLEFIQTAGIETVQLGVVMEYTYAVARRI